VRSFAHARNATIYSFHLARTIKLIVVPKIDAHRSASSGRIVTRSAGNFHGKHFLQPRFHVRSIALTRCLDDDCAARRKMIARINASRRLSLGRLVHEKRGEGELRRKRESTLAAPCSLRVGRRLEGAKCRVFEHRRETRRSDRCFTLNGRSSKQSAGDLSSGSAL